jgi:hypothetical protein
MKIKDIIPGMRCTVNRHGDIYFDTAIRLFLGADCIVIKITKSGLVQVALTEFPKQVYSVPAHNISLLL